LNIPKNVCKSVQKLPRKAYLKSSLQETPKKFSRKAQKLSPNQSPFRANYMCHKNKTPIFQEIIPEISSSISINQIRNVQHRNKCSHKIKFCQYFFP
jgi:hypothetical protein